MTNNLEKTHPYIRMVRTNGDVYVIHTRHLDDAVEQWPMDEMLEIVALTDAPDGHEFCDWDNTPLR